MLLLTVLLAAAAWSYAFAQEIPVQSPRSITKSKDSVRLDCDLKGVYGDLRDIAVHWYQQKPNDAPERILYHAGAKVVDGGFQAHRYTVEKFPSQKLCTLTIKDITPDDAATYYCAYWYRHCVWPTWIKYFGTGTKLIISDKGSSPPENSEILQKTHENQITYVCLIEKFYPEVIRVTWTDEENKEITDNVVKGDTWKPAEGDEYSVGSWLTVPVENKHKNYYCKYEHESQQHSLMTRDSKKNALQDEDCSTHPGNGTVFNRDHLFHRTAYLVYIALLLKSSMYYIIVLLFMYRMWAPTKQQGKKA
ncbi:immunoglobulin kappa light chain isoform X2 [Falco cherrug]|uniref:immunoglobulin kappa light chain isoform X2 n=1 Tax=Falco cherrug TaxID=345164 RepID=UPI002479D35A|nr:immunoglobulin kappa light chain isoform X2 [Falco cherrug]